jgi:hypothetical protein
MNTQAKQGQHVIFTDEDQCKRDALVTFVHGEQCVNLIVVCKDMNRQDAYGMQTEHKTSICHKRDAGPGYYYELP